MRLQMNVCQGKTRFYTQLQQPIATAKIFNAPTKFFTPLHVAGGKLALDSHFSNMENIQHRYQYIPDKYDAFRPKRILGKRGLGVWDEGRGRKQKCLPLEGICIACETDWMQSQEIIVDHLGHPYLSYDDIWYVVRDYLYDGMIRIMDKDDYDSIRTIYTIYTMSEKHINHIMVPANESHSECCIVVEETEEGFRVIEGLGGIYDE